MEQEKVLLENICAEISNGVEATIASAERKSSELISNLCKKVLDGDGVRKIVLMTGPSGCGKTTTAHKMADYFKANGKGVEIVSLNSFYLDKDNIPCFSDGRLDLLSVKALDIDRIKTFATDFLENGICRVPIFDFISKTRTSDSTKTNIGENSIVILEGLHALNPAVVNAIPSKYQFKIYVSVATSVVDSTGQVLLGKRDVRFLRRLMRDQKFRDATVNETFDIWDSVIQRERKYLVPYKGTADMQMNSYHFYEPSALADEALVMLKSIDISSQHVMKAQRMIEVLEKFPRIKKRYIPRDSLLREFLGY